MCTHYFWNKFLTFFNFFDRLAKSWKINVGLKEKSNFLNMLQRRFKIKWRVHLQVCLHHLLSVHLMQGFRFLYLLFSIKIILLVIMIWIRKRILICWQILSIILIIWITITITIATTITIIIITTTITVLTVMSVITSIIVTTTITTTT